jgi:hypothetical protein
VDKINLVATKAIKFLTTGMKSVPTAIRLAEIEYNAMLNSHQLEEVNKIVAKALLNISDN